MMRAIEFLHAWRGDPSLCSALVVDWLQHRGHALTLSQRRQRRDWRAFGTIEGADQFAALLGLGRTDTPGEGDVAAFASIEGPSLGLVVGTGRIGFVPRAGQVIVSRTPCIAAWGVPCRRS